MNNRLAKLEVYIEENKLDAMYISSYENYRYFSGFSGSNCHLIVTREEKIIITDGRYHSQAKEEAPEWTLIAQRGAAAESIRGILEEKGIKTIGYEGMKLSDYQVRNLREECPHVTWVPRDSFGVFPRMFKDEGELSNIQRAVEIADVALGEMCKNIHPGMTERQVAAELEYLMAKNGSEHIAFETISASGPRGALPHGAPTDRVIEENDMLTLDFGACYAGYMSDITRTIWFGTPSDELCRIWYAVYDAQQTAIAAVCPGIKASELDRIHRQVLEKHGLGDYIMHSLGHGVGLEIHEEPRVSSGSSVELEPGMVITIEPGVYIPGVGGVRTEDMVAVTKDGAQVLTQSPHLIKIPGGRE